jgi:hypothetical protein
MMQTAVAMMTLLMLTRNDGDGTGRWLRGTGR